MARYITVAMPSERLQRQIDRLLDDAEQAAEERDWATMLSRAEAALDLDPANEDALGFAVVARRGLGDAYAAGFAGQVVAAEAATPTQTTPTSFGGGRYRVRESLGEGSKKLVHLAHHELLDRDVALALIKTEGLDQVGRERIAREAQAMGRLGAHPHVVSVFDLGDHEGQPFIVSELMGGGDVEGLLKDADGPLPTAQALEIAKGVCRGLAFAHEKGVVHRDIKPGNVWLTEEGVARAGDSTSRSRQTAPGSRSTG